MNISLYAHGGSANHGCEALARSTIQSLEKGNKFTLLSERPEEDLKYGLNEIARIESSQDVLPEGLQGFLYKLKMKFTHDERIYYKSIYRNAIRKSGDTDIAIAIGGDNYCYKGFAEQFGVLNDMFIARRIPCVLWGCSIDPHRINKHLIEYLSKYQLITVRESITYKALKESSIRSLYLISDTAFKLKKIECESSEEFGPPIQSLSI